MVKITRDFDVDLTPGAVKAAFSAAGAVRAEGTYMIPRSAVSIMEGFNVRGDTPEYKSHVRALANSMLAEGWFPHEPLPVIVLKDENGDDVIFATGGHSRLAAYDVAKSENKKLQDMIPVVIRSRETTLIDLFAALANDNQGKPLSAYELAVIARRLHKMEVSVEDIAARLGKTDRYVRDLLLLADAPAPIRSAVVRGHISATEAVKQIRAEGDAAAETIARAVEKAKASGRDSVTAKDLPSTGQRKPGKGVTTRTPRTTTVPAAEVRAVATGTDFILGAINYALDTATDGLAWLKLWRDGDADTIAELETHMGQPAGATNNPALRVPLASAAVPTAGESAPAAGPPDDFDLNVDEAPAADAKAETPAKAEKQAVKKITRASAPHKKTVEANKRGAEKAAAKKTSSRKKAPAAEAADANGGL